MRITELFDNGQFVVTAEVGPPKGIHVDHLVEEAKEYLGGITAVNVTDNQSSVMRLGSLATCKILKDAGLTPIYQLTCRDRNRIALQSDLLSAAALGIDTILTSGGAGNCLGGMETIRQLIRLREETGGPEVLIGAGVNAAVIAQLKARFPQARAFHMSGKMELESGMRFRREGVPMGLPMASEFDRQYCDPELVRQAKEILLTL